jgi:hypothetical protein
MTALRHTCRVKLRVCGVDETGSGLCGFSNGAVFWYVTPGVLVRIYTDFVRKFESMCRQSSKQSCNVGKSVLYFLIPFHHNGHNKF